MKYVECIDDRDRSEGKTTDPTNDWDTSAVWVDARRAVTVTRERHTDPQDKTLSQRGCHTS